MLRRLCLVLAVTLLARVAAGQPQAPILKGLLADYNSELRLPDRRVDIDGMTARLKDLGVNTYMWLIWHAPTDWDDLKLFLPKAADAGIQVWVYLVPPSEAPPPEPFRLDYLRWAEEIAKLSLQHPNLTAWVIDDFYANARTFTPAYVGEMQARAKGVNPRLAFLPLMYYREITPRFVNDYRKVIDGVVVAYPQDLDEIALARDILNGNPLPYGEMDFPAKTPSKPEDFVMAAQTVAVLPAERYVLRFRERDDFTGKTAGYHFKQLLVDDAVVWEQDVAGGERRWSDVTVDVTAQAKGKRTITIAFRLLDKKGVSQFGLSWWLRGLQAEGLQLAAPLEEPQKWKVTKRGAFSTNLGQVPRKTEGPPFGKPFGLELKADRLRAALSSVEGPPIPFIVMTAASAGEFRHRHGDPASPERIAEWLRMSLQSWRDGRCDGVVTYCLDKRPESTVFPLARELFHNMQAAQKP
jgi:hypothetical protein